jgi:hypothetical protein
MSCNAFNHRSDCSCGFGGANYGSATRLPWATYPSILRLHTDWGCWSSYTIPNVRCWDCGEAVFFHRSPNGGSVLFDALGPPWPIHPCFEERVRRHQVRQHTDSGASGSSGSGKSPNGEAGGDASGAVRGGPDSLSPTPNKPISTGEHWYELYWLDIHPHPNDGRITIVKAKSDLQEFTLFCDDPGRRLLTRGPMFYRPRAGRDGYDISALVDAQAQTLEPKKFVGFYDCGHLLQWRSAENSKIEQRAGTQNAEAHAVVDLKKKPESSLDNIQPIGDWQAFRIRKVTLDPQNITKINLKGLADRFDIFISGTSLDILPDITVYLRPIKLMLKTGHIKCYELKVSNDLSQYGDQTERTRLAYICEQDLAASLKHQQRTPKKSHTDIAQGGPSSLHKVQGTLSANQARSRVRRIKPRSRGYGTRLSSNGTSTYKRHPHSTSSSTEPT